MSWKTASIVPLCYRQGVVHALLYTKKGVCDVLKQKQVGSFEETVSAALKKNGLALATHVNLTRRAFEPGSKMQVVFVLIDEGDITYADEQKSVWLPVDNPEARQHLLSALKLTPAFLVPVVLSYVNPRGRRYDHTLLEAVKSDYFAR